MTDLAQLPALERVRALTGPDRETDAAIYNLFPEDQDQIAFKVANWATPPGSRLDRYHDGWIVGRSEQDQYAENLPRFLSSIDDAVALARRLLPGCGVGFDYVPMRNRDPVRAWLNQSDDQWTYEGWPQQTAPTPALAIVLAALVAKQADAASPPKEAGEP